MEEHLSWRQLRARAIPRSAILDMQPWNGLGVTLIEFEHEAGTLGEKPYLGWVELEGGQVSGYTCTCKDAKSRKQELPACKHADHVALEYLDPSVAIPISIQLPTRAVRATAGG